MSAMFCSGSGCQLTKRSFEKEGKATTGLADADPVPLPESEQVLVEHLPFLAVRHRRRRRFDPPLRTKHLRVFPVRLFPALKDVGTHADFDTAGKVTAGDDCASWWDHARQHPWHCGMQAERLFQAGLRSGGKEESDFVLRGAVYGRKNAPGSIRAWKQLRR